MNQAQFKLIAAHKLRKTKVIKACHDVLFGGLNNNQAEVKHSCSKASVAVALRSVRDCYALTVKVGKL